MTRGIQPMAATALAGAGSLATLAMSVMTMKVYAVLIGPEGVGVYALLLSVLNLALLLAGLGLSTSVIRAVASAESSTGRSGAAAVARVALISGITGGAVGALLLIAFREPIAEFALGNSARAGDVTLLAPALLATTVGAVGSGALVGLRRLPVATAITVASAVVGTAAGIGLVVVLGLDGLAPALLTAALIQVGLVTVALHRAGIRVGAVSGGPREFVDKARRLLSLGVTVAAGHATTTVAMIVIPLIVLHMLGRAEVGYYRAAVAISIGLGAVFVTGIHHDFLPRLAAVDDPAQRKALIDTRMRIVLGIATPAILALLAVGPLVIDLLYTAEFRPSADILQWQLIGDLVRLPTIVLATAALAMQRRAAFLVLEVLVAVITVGGSAVGITAIGLVGPGVAYAAAYGAAYVVGWVVLHSQTGVTPGRLQAAMVATVALSCLLVILVGDPALRSASFASGAVIIAVLSGQRLIRAHRSAEF